MSAQNASTSATAARAAAGDSVLPRATNAIVTWISEYYGRAIAEMRAGGQLIQDEVLAHLWPTHHDNVNFFGTITWTSTVNWPSSTPMDTAHSATSQPPRPPSTEHHRPATRDRSRPRRVGWLVV